MKRYDTEQSIREARPDHPSGFTTSVQGEAMLAAVLDTTRQPAQRSRRRALGIAGAVAAGVLFTGGATAAIGGYDAPTAPREALPANGEAFMCATAGLQRMGDTAASADASPLDACRRAWSELFDDEAPRHLYPCVKAMDDSPSPEASASPSTHRWNGMLYVLDGDQFANAPQTCGAVGMMVAPIAE
ncbi:hypothetical protein ACQP2H_30165 [Micromonospora sp. CA-248260]|uniref:hypothetical protein n=1 Tax=unclassified Micromonospora TaxID=2617518 RepID=UPI00344152E0